jgi:plasmid maintenance system antidote protein VapI
MKRVLDFADKPYYKCLVCSHFSEKRCGIPLSRLPLIDWCICIRVVKEAKHLTNNYVAEKADVSVKTIEKIVALNCDADIRRDTARRIEDVVFGEPCDIVCYLEIANSVPEASEMLNTAMIDLERALSDNDDIRKAMDNVQISHAAEIQAIRDEDQKKIDYLREQLLRLQRDNDNLWEENKRKSRLIDKLLESKTDIHVE